MRRNLDSYSADDYEAAFRLVNLTDYRKKMLLAHYRARKRTVTATQLSTLAGSKPCKSPANAHYGKLGGLIGEGLELHHLPKYKVNVLVTFDKKPRRELHWIMRPAVAKAVQRLLCRRRNRKEKPR